MAKSHRIQGRDWRDIRRNHTLKLLCLSKSKAGNYRADMVDETGYHYHHWLSCSEVEKLKQSGFLDNHKVIDHDDLYRHGNMDRIWRREAIVNDQQTENQTSSQEK